MTSEDIIKELTETTARSKSNTKRIDELAERQEELKSLATSTAVMAQRLGAVEENVNDIKKSVESLKAEPGEKWKDFASKVLWLVLGGVIAYALASIGLS